MRRVVLAGLLASLALAGCGGGDDDDKDEGPKEIDQRTAVAEARSAASQAASVQDVSLPFSAFSARCKPLPGGAWRCVIRSADRSCRGTIELAPTPSGSPRIRRERVMCKYNG